MKNDFLIKRFNPDPIYDWESGDYLKVCLELVSDEKNEALCIIHGKSPKIFLDRLNQQVVK